MEQSKEVCLERTANINKRLDSGERRMDKHSETIDRLDRLIAEMAAINKNHDEVIKSHENRITDLEQKPGKWWDKVVAAVISIIVSTAMAYIIK